MLVLMTLNLTLTLKTFVRLVLLVLFQVKPRKTRISFVTVKWREMDFHRRFHFRKGRHLQLKQSCAKDTDTDTSTSKTVVFSFAQDCYREATVLSHLLQEQRKIKMNCEFLTLPQVAGMKAPKLQLLDSADMVVVMVSDEYLASSQHRHELHIALCRQRMVRAKYIFKLDIY